jgi:hypothetical protein
MLEGLAPEEHQLSATTCVSIAGSRPELMWEEGGGSGIERSPGVRTRERENPGPEGLARGSFSATEVVETYLVTC